MVRRFLPRVSLRPGRKKDASMQGSLSTERHLPNLPLATMEERWKLMYGEEQRSPNYNVTHYITYLRRHVAGTGQPKSGQPAKKSTRSKTVDNGRPQDSISPLSYFIRKLKLDLKISYQSFVGEFIQAPNNGLRLLLSLLRNLSTFSSEPASVSSAGTLRLEEYKKTMIDEHDCLLCIKYTLRAPNAVEELLDDNDGLLCVTSCLMSHFSRSRVTALEILTLTLTGPTSVDKLLETFTTQRIKHAESTRFKMLVNMMYTRGTPNIIFQVCCLRLFNSMLSLCRSANMRVYLQHELEEAGLDTDRLAQSAHGDGLEYDDLRKEIREWTTRFINVDALLRKIRADLKSDGSKNALNEYIYDQQFAGSYNPGWQEPRQDPNGFVEYTDWLLFMERKQLTAPVSSPPPIPAPRPAVYYPKPPPPVPVTSSLQVEVTNQHLTVPAATSTRLTASSADHHTLYDIISCGSDRTSEAIPELNGNGIISTNPNGHTTETFRGVVSNRNNQNGTIDSTTISDAAMIEFSEEDTSFLGSESSTLRNRFAITNVPSATRHQANSNGHRKARSARPVVAEHDQEKTDSNWFLKPKDNADDIDRHLTRHRTSPRLQMYQDKFQIPLEGENIENSPQSHTGVNGNHREILLPDHRISGSENARPSTDQHHRSDRPSQAAVRRIQSVNAADAYMSDPIQNDSQPTRSQHSFNSGPLKWYNPGINGSGTNGTLTHIVSSNLRTNPEHLRGQTGLQVQLPDNKGLRPGTSKTLPRTPSPDYLPDDESKPQDRPKRPLTYPHVVRPMTTQTSATLTYNNVDTTVSSSQPPLKAKSQTATAKTPNVRSSIAASTQRTMGTYQNFPSQPRPKPENWTVGQPQNNAAKASNASRNTKSIKNQSEMERRSQKTSESNTGLRDTKTSPDNALNNTQVPKPNPRTSSLLKAKSESSGQNQSSAAHGSSKPTNQTSLTLATENKVSNTRTESHAEKENNLLKSASESELLAPEKEKVNGTDSVRSYSAEIGRVLGDLDLALENHGWQASIKSHMKSRSTLIAYV